MDVGYQSHDLLPLPRAIAASSPPSSSFRLHLHLCYLCRCRCSCRLSLSSSFSSFPSLVSFTFFVAKFASVSRTRLLRLIVAKTRASYPKDNVFRCFSSSLLISSIRPLRKSSPLESQVSLPRNDSNNDRNNCCGKCEKFISKGLKTCFFLPCVGGTSEMLIPDPNSAAT